MRLVTGRSAGPLAPICGFNQHVVAKLLLHGSSPALHTRVLAIIRNEIESTPDLIHGAQAVAVRLAGSIAAHHGGKRIGERRDSGVRIALVEGDAGIVAC